MAQDQILPYYAQGHYESDMLMPGWESSKIENVKVRSIQKVRMI